MKSMYRTPSTLLYRGWREISFLGQFFRGIYAIELSDDGLSLKDGATPQQVAGTAYEGTYIHKKDGHYYFFAP